MSHFYGLTGGIGSGKSTVVQMFADLGVPTLDLDEVGKVVIQALPEVTEKLVAAFGQSIVDENRALLRKSLARVAFASAESTQQLNRIIHPYIVAYESDWKAKQTAPFCMIEASVLIESSGVARMDGLLVVFADMELRRQRVLQRNQGDGALFNKIVQQQCSDEQRHAVADFALENNQSLDVLRQQVLQLYTKLQNEVNSG